MKRMHRSSALGTVVVGVIIHALGCTPSPDSGNTTLTDSEKQALQSSLSAAKAITTAVVIGQNGTASEPLNAESQARARTIGICPVVTTDVSTSDPVELALVIDFGSGCSPVYWPGVTCAGGATGKIRPETGDLRLTFNVLTCNGDTLAGMAAATFSRADAVTNVSGTWDLTWTEDSTQVTTQGAGVSQYDSATCVTTIPTFSGSVSDGSATWSLALADVLVSYKAYGSYVPYAGTMIVEGAGIRKLYVRFSAASPAAGDIEISLDGSHYVTLNLDALFGLLL